MADQDDETKRRLRQIADTLGIPVEHLFDGATPAELVETEECLRLWYRLRTDAGRKAVLDYLRKTLEGEGD